MKPRLSLSCIFGALLATYTFIYLLTNISEKPGSFNFIPSAVDISFLDGVKARTKCIDKPIVQKMGQRGEHWVLYNYLPAEKSFKCHETITYTTHGDYSFLDNLLPLLDRWQGPISISLYASGTDFQPTLDSILHLRQCTTNHVKEFVSFHVYFRMDHFPKNIPDFNIVQSMKYNCSSKPGYLNVTRENMYKNIKGLLYPVNVGRNVAREMAQTHFIFASDIELYPSRFLILNFLKMIAANKGFLNSSNRPKVFPLHLFEIDGKHQIPENKTILLKMLQSKTAIPFHKKICPNCHNIPKAKEWMRASETTGLNVYFVGKRSGYFTHWEPIFIGTNEEPFYDERLSWEGQSDKMTQGYALCVLNYDFMILDNAFLVHKPGIKIYKKDPKREALIHKTNGFIRKTIFPELKILYGVKNGCQI